MPLPVPVVSALPTTQFALGASADGPIPSIYFVVDTGAGCTCGSMEFFLTLCISCPEILHSSVVAKDSGYESLTLSGVVGEDGTMVTTTELPLAMTFYIPHKTIEGEQILFTVRVGKHVLVYFFLGVPFLKTAKATFNLEADCLTAPVFRDFSGWPV